MTENTNCKRIINFACEAYLEDDNWDYPIKVANENGMKFLYAIHDKDIKEDGELKKKHCHILVHLNNAMTMTAIMKKFRVRYVEAVKDFIAYGVYLTHTDIKSKEEGKFLYGIEVLQGNCIEVIKNRIQKDNRSKKENDNDILLILDFIDSCDYVSMNVLIRWCCNNNLYGVLRRAGRIITEVLYEHNRNCEYTLKDTLYKIRLDEMEKRMTAAEKELERAYGDLFTRVKNPFDGKIVTDGIKSETLESIRNGIKEIAG